MSLGKPIVPGGPRATSRAAAASVRQNAETDELRVLLAQTQSIRTRVAGVETPHASGAPASIMWPRSEAVRLFLLVVGIALLVLDPRRIGENLEQPERHVGDEVGASYLRLHGVHLDLAQVVP